MDLIGELAAKLGVDPAAAQALAGAALGGAQEQVAKQVGTQEAAQMAAAIPELSGWKDAATSMLGGGGGGDAGGLLGGALGALGGAGGLGGALGGALGALGGGDAAGGLPALAGMLGKLNLSPGLITSIAPLLLNFLQDRLPKELLDKVKSVLPLLGGGGQADLGSMLGGLLK